VGASHQMRFGTSRFGYYVRLGIHATRLSLHDDDGDEISETDTAQGLQTAAGVKFHFTDSWAFRGGFQYNLFSDNLERTVGGRNDIDLDLFTLTFGGSYSF